MPDKNIYMVNENVHRFFLYIGFGISKSDLKSAGERFEFSSIRERKEFRESLKRKKPQDIQEVVSIYTAFVNRNCNKINIDYRS
jgi:hypothetical protein